MTAILAGAIVVPVLVALYFLKLRRRPAFISSTLFWKRAVQDLQVNAPFQRLRRNILLLLQLLALAALVAVLGTPLLSWGGGPGKRYVLLIDRSASMNARDADGETRLEAAKKRARDFIKTLREENLFAGFGQGDEAMVMTFGSDPQVICSFLGDKRRLIDAINSIRPTDGRTKINEAFRIARAFATPTDPEAMGRSTVTPARLVLFTDGNIQDLGEVAAKERELTVYQVGTSGDNTAVVTLQARRAFDDPEQVAVFATLANYGTKPVDGNVELRLDGKTVSAQHMTLPGARESPETKTNVAGEMGLTFSLRMAGGGLIEVRNSTVDPLPADNTAWIVLNPPKRVSVLLVTPGNLVLEEALKSLPLASFETLSPEAFEKTAPEVFETVRPIDVIILDRCTPSKLPRSAFLTFGPGPKLDGLDCQGPLDDQMILDWRTNHPALKYIDLESVYAKTWWKHRLPGDAHVLAESDRGPAMSLLTRQARTFLLVNFDVLQSNWPFRPGFVMFLYNAVRFLGQSGGGSSDGSLSVGSSFTVKVPPDVREVQILRPGETPIHRTPDPGGILRYAPLDRVGVYRVQFGSKQVRAFVVNLLDPAESNIHPAKTVAFGGQKASVTKAVPVRANLELKPFLLIAALIVLLLEWFIYNKKVRI